MLATLAGAAEPHHVVIVNDGSPDATGEVADRLAARYPERVIVVHHPVNRGYGAAVRTGIEAALDQTDSRRLFLTDSDGQFRAAQLPDFIREARTERADAVIGYRKKRADPIPAQDQRQALGLGVRAAAAGAGPGRGLRLQAHRPAGPGRGAAAR